MNKNNDAILQAVQSGFVNVERQFTALFASNSRIEAEVAEIKTILAIEKSDAHDR